MQKLLDLLSKRFPTLSDDLIYTLSIGEFTESLCLKIGIGPRSNNASFTADWSNQYFTVGIPYEIVPALVDYLSEETPSDVYNIINIHDGTIIETISGDQAYETVGKIMSDAVESIQRFLDVYSFLI